MWVLKCCNGRKQQSNYQDRAKAEPTTKTRIIVAMREGERERDRERDLSERL